jgi:hypothetical protein
MTSYRYLVVFGNMHAVWSDVIGKFLKIATYGLVVLSILLLLHCIHGKKGT